MAIPTFEKQKSDQAIAHLTINTIRTLSIDAIQKAKSGHPGTPMALAPLVYTLWNRVMHFDPKDPIWPNRDRFILSNGHASMLLWSILHLTGTQAVDAEYENLGKPSVSLDDIRRFRQIAAQLQIESPQRNLRQRMRRIGRIEQVGIQHRIMLHSGQRNARLRKML